MNGSASCTRSCRAQGTRMGPGLKKPRLYMSKHKSQQCYRIQLIMTAMHQNWTVCYIWTGSNLTSALTSCVTWHKSCNPPMTLLLHHYCGNDGNAQRNAWKTIWDNVWEKSRAAQWICHPDSLKINSEIQFELSFCKLLITLTPVCFLTPATVYFYQTKKFC